MTKIYEAVTNNIHIMVEPRYIVEQSQPDRNIYVFSYIVTIVNIGILPVTLINRHWRVFSAEKQIADVKGDGVVGTNPELVTGLQFQYVSGTVINQPVGLMKGIYTFQDSNGNFFDANVPDFHLHAIESNKLN